MQSAKFFAMRFCGGESPRSKAVWPGGSATEGTNRKPAEPVFNALDFCWRLNAYA
jgi:hypothetical protein